MEIAEIITTDGEVISLNDFKSQKEYLFSVLNKIDYNLIEEFYFKKTIVLLVKTNNKLTNGGISIIQLEQNLLLYDKIKFALKELEDIKAIVKKEGINLDLYYPKQKK